MITNTEKELEKIFMSYNRVLTKLKLLNVNTKSNKRISDKDLRYAIDLMQRKHSTCRWKCRKAKSSKVYILIEGYYWLIYVYFQTEKTLIDADIDFFETRIKQYEELLLIEPKDLFKTDMFTSELPQYFNKKPETIRKAITKMSHHNKDYKFIENEKNKISKEGVEWLCKTCFKQKYLELLEQYKMELTDIYIEKGYPYDIF